MPSKKIRNHSFAVTSFSSIETQPVYNEDEMKYLVYEPEWTQAGKFHWQIYVYYTKLVNVDKVIEDFTINDVHPHVELARGSPQKNIDYCTKDRGKTKHGVLVQVTENGERPKQGAQSQLQDIERAIRID